jgi:signal transduction histidine kinase
VIRRALAAHPKSVDILIVVGFLIGCALMTIIDYSSSSYTVVTPEDLKAGREVDVPLFGVAPAYLAGPIAVVSVLRIALVALALYFRRRFPLTGLVVVSLAQLGDHGLQGVATVVALYFMLYAVPVYRTVAAGWVAYAIALVSTTIAVFVFPRSEDAGANDDFLPVDTIEQQISSGVIMALWLLAILMLGINLGNRRRYLQAVIDRAHQLARERDQRAQLAVAEERSRIAREMHDIVAHSVSVMIALSEGASRAIEVAPEAAAEALQRSAETGRSALVEMRRLLGALQEPGAAAAELAPQPGATDIPDLVQGFRDAGLTIRLELTGEFEEDKGKGLALYRVVQEALTNVLRYAGSAANAIVSIRYGAEGVSVEVRDSGPALGVVLPVAGLGSGRGLAGLAERVRVFGGEFDSGPMPGEPGWYVRATLPKQTNPPGSKKGISS